MIFKSFTYISALALLLGLCPLSLAELKNKDADFSNQIAIRTFEKLSGSSDEGSPVTNSDNSLSCSLTSWQLIGIFNNGRIRRTRGELVFEITNNSPESRKFVLAELLVKSDRGKTLVISNPHRELQGDVITFDPPLKPGETRKFVRKIWYKSGWHEIDLKTCRWLGQPKEYWEIYPELKEDSTI